MTSVHLRSLGGTDHAVFDGEAGLEVGIGIAQDRGLDAPAVEVSIYSPDGTLLWRGSQSLDASLETAVLLTFPRLGLTDGNYRLDVGVFAAHGRICCDFQKGLHAFAVRCASEGAGCCVWCTVGPRAPAVPRQGT